MADPIEPIGLTLREAEAFTSLKKSTLYELRREARERGDEITAKIRGRTVWLVEKLRALMQHR